MVHVVVAAGRGWEATNGTGGRQKGVGHEAQGEAVPERAAAS